MATNSAFEWTEVTWNPVTGCDRVATGCDNWPREVSSDPPE